MTLLPSRALSSCGCCGFTLMPFLPVDAVLPREGEIRALSSRMPLHLVFVFEFTVLDPWGTGGRILSSTWVNSVTISPTRLLFRETGLGWSAPRTAAVAAGLGSPAGQGVSKRGAPAPTKRHLQLGDGYREKDGAVEMTSPGRRFRGRGRETAR